MALEQLLENDGYLFHNQANERSLCHRLALYMEGLFKGYSVDCEYNRSAEESKRMKFDVEEVEKGLGNKNSSKDLEAKTVYPDIIVHKRGDNSDNLVVIEAKKDTNKDSDNDKIKIKKYMNQLKYKNGFLVKFNVANKPSYELYEIGGDNGDIKRVYEYQCRTP